MQIFFAIMFYRVIVKLIQNMENELDSNFVVSEYLSSNGNLHTALDAMTVPQRFQVEQAMNAILAKTSRDEQKDFVERCTQLQQPKPSWHFQILLHCGDDLNFWFPDIESFTKRLFAWLTTVPASIIIKNNKLKFVHDDLQCITQNEFIEYWSKNGNKSGAYHDFDMAHIDGVCIWKITDPCPVINHSYCSLSHK